MLPKSEHVEQVYYKGDNNLLSARDSWTEGQRSKKLFIECSTIDPVVTREVGAKVQESGLGDMADAAVSVSIHSLLQLIPSNSCLHRAALSAPKKAHSPT